MSSIFQHVSTDAVAEADRFDFWQACFLGAHLDRHPEDAGTPFEGRLVAAGDAQHAIFQDMRNSGLVSHFGRRESGLVLLGFVREGEVRVRDGSDRREIFDRSSGLILFDCDRPITTVSQDVSLCCLSLPREIAMVALERDRSVRPAPMLRLPQTGLGAVWRAQMDEMARSGGTLSQAGSLATIQAASALAFAVLSGSVERANPGLADEAMYETACRLVRMSADEPTLTSAKLARRLGCSRSHLYRLFADRGQTIAGYAREVRLERARHLLTREPGTPVSLIALRCGYGDLSAFGKAFRRRFDVSPSEFREAFARGRDED